jgi:hypothetical protein
MSRGSLEALPKDIYAFLLRMIARPPSGLMRPALRCIQQLNRSTNFMVKLRKFQDPLKYLVQSTDYTFHLTTSRSVANDRLPRSSWRDAMLTSADYREMADRSAQLAIASPAASVGEALLALALHYMTQSTSCGLSTSQQLSQCESPLQGFGD